MSMGPGPMGPAERPVSPRVPASNDPSSQATPIRGEASLRPSHWSGPPTSPPSARFGRPADRYEIPAPPPEVVERKIPWRRVLGWFVVVVLVGMAAGWGYVRFLHNPVADPDTEVSTSASAGPKIPRADDLVRQYLQALSVGDTETAMSLGQVGNGNPAAITPEAYAISLERYPITDIRVPQMDNATTEVPASYRIGETEVNTRFRVVRDDSGSWALAHSTVQVELQNPTAASMPVLVNGVPIPSGIAEVLPGHYEVSTGLPLVAYPANNAVTITNLEYDGRVQRVLTPVLTDAGRDAMLAAGRAALSACMHSGSLTPAGCPNQLASSAPYDAASVQWELVNNPFVDANPALDPIDQTLGQVSLVLRFGVRFSYSDGSTNGYQELAAVSASYSGSLLATDADQLSVFWR